MPDGAFDLVAIGEPLVEFNQARGDGRTWLQGFGGDTSNTVIAASRLGARTAYFTRIGDDAFGRLLLELWRREGVDAGTVQTDASAPTGIYFVTHGPHGHAFSYRRDGSAASRMRAHDVPEPLIRSARFLHVSGISQAIGASARDAVRHAVRVARQAGVRVAYDPNLRPALWTPAQAAEALDEIMEQVDVFLPGLEDLRALTGIDDPHRLVDWCHARGAPTVVLKLGARGALASVDGVRTLVDAFPVRAVDATGAGDCFDAALLVRLGAGDGLADATRFACAAAALSTRGYGAVDPLPGLDDVTALIARGADPVAG